MIYEPDWPNFVLWLKDWQTLVGAAIAIPFAAGAIAVPTMIEWGRSRRRFIAARATLPLHLSAVGAYAQDAGIAVAACRTTDGTNDAAIRAFEKPPIPPGLIENLERLIEATNDQRVIRRMGRMIGIIQVLDSRMTSVADAGGNGPYFDSMIMDCALIHAQVDSMFDFARGEARTIPDPLPWELVKTALNIMRIRDWRYTSLVAMIERYAARDRNPEAVSKTVRRWAFRRRFNSIRAEIYRRLPFRKSASSVGAEE